MTTPRQTSRRTFLAHSAAALALTGSGCPIHAALSHGWGPHGALAPSALPQPVDFGSIHAGGDLAHRTAQNFARLQEDLYRPPQVFRGTNWRSWPGDMEGRALLAVTLLSRATGQEPDYFPAMVAAYPAQLNPQGYFGPLLDLHAINEQQLSGHGWFLRGLCEYYEYKHDPATLAQIRAVITNLALPLRGKYAAYPIDPAVRAAATAPANPGSVDGHLSGQHGDWAVSSDTGCAFIFLDGLVHAWVVLRAANSPEAPALKALIDEAIARFLQVDLVAIKAQTHASLTALRALLRVYAETHDSALLAAVRDRYHLYRTTAMTEHYANTNWFGRPDSWTEPCAILDSFMVATELWQFTGDPAYLEDAHRIWFNGVGRGLRSNGVLGTDTCDYHSDFVLVRIYDSYFCCTMRGGEGHARAAQYLYFTRPAQFGKPAELNVPFFSNSEATLNLGTAVKTAAHHSPPDHRLSLLARSPHRGGGCGSCAHAHHAAHLRAQLDAEPGAAAHVEAEWQPRALVARQRLPDCPPHPPHRRCARVRRHGRRRPAARAQRRHRPRRLRLHERPARPRLLPVRRPRRHPPFARPHADPASPPLIKNCWGHPFRIPPRESSSMATGTANLYRRARSATSLPPATSCSRPSTTSTPSPPRPATPAPGKSSSAMPEPLSASTPPPSPPHLKNTKTKRDRPGPRAFFCGFGAKGRRAWTGRRRNCETHFWSEFPRFTPSRQAPGPIRQDTTLGAICPFFNYIQGVKDGVWKIGRSDVKRGAEFAAAKNKSDSQRTRR